MPRFSKHALEQMNFRGIDVSVVAEILLKPQQILFQENLSVYQSVIEDKGRKYLIRIFVNLHKTPALVVTVYKTSNIEKYWQ